MRCRLKKTNKRLEEQSGDERPGVSARALSLPPYHAMPHYFYTMPYYKIPHHAFLPYHTIPNYTIPYCHYHRAVGWKTDMPHALIQRFPHSRTLLCVNMQISIPISLRAALEYRRLISVGRSCRTCLFITIISSEY